MNRITLFLIILANQISAMAADIQQDGGKASSATSEFKSGKEYDAEANIRISSFTLPDDIKATLFADPSQTQNPSAICFDSKGRLYVAEIHRWRAGVQDIRNEQQILLDDINNQTSQDRLEMYERDQLTRPISFYEDFDDRIVRIQDRDGDGRADSTAVWADGFNHILDGPGIGLVAGQADDIFYTNIPHLWHLIDSDNSGRATEKTSLQEGFGVRMSISGHDMHGIVWGPDGKLYWSIGDRGYDLTTKEGRHYHRNYEGAVFRCDPDGSNLEEIYRGLRNPQELAFDKFGNLFTCDNDADAWDKGRLVYILEGGNSGWNHGHQVILNFKKQLKLRTPEYAHPDHKTVPMSPWLAEGIWETDHEGRPAYTLPPIDIVSWGPSGLVYNYGVTTMPERYADHFWVCNFGGANGDLEAFTVKPKGAGFSLDQHETFMVGLGNTDVEFGPDGRMYLSCFNNNGWYKQDIGNVYALSSPDPSNPDLLHQTHELLTTEFPTLLETELSDLLGHADLRVRQRAQFDLVRRNSVSILAAAIEQTERPLKRLHGVWGLGQLSRKDESLLRLHIELLSDADSQVRAQAAKVLSDSRSETAGEALFGALDDQSARVKSFAAIGVGKCNYPTALPKLIEILEANNNRDVFLRHACIQGLWGLNQREKMLKQLNHDSPAVRLGILLTLRKLEDPRVKYFLHDDSKLVRDEAIRAINDLDLITALPDLAGEINVYAQGHHIESIKDHRDWLTQTRIINANFRVGTLENAASLLQYAAQSQLPAILREQALLALLEWNEPNPVDSTNGFYRPLDASTRLDVSTAVKSELPAVFTSAQGTLLSLAIKLALQNEVEAPVELLTRQTQDESANIEARIASLEGLASQSPEALLELIDELLLSKEPQFKSSVVEQLLKIAPERGLQEALDLADSKKIRLRQSGYHLLATQTDDAANELFARRLATIDTEPASSLLDLLDAAALKRDIPDIAAELAAYESSLDPTDVIAPFLPTLEGGDIEKGEDIFMTHAIGQCAKCHKINGDGGVAGPDLTGIGDKYDAKYFLQSLVDPSAVVVPGYGLTLMTLKNGESIGGAFLRETDEAVVLKVSDPEDSAKQIEKMIPLDQIASRQPPVSAMPPMGFALKKSEVRDLVAFLSSLKGKKTKKKNH
tara:strand:+ start:504 stop:3950 length:3447 start_codon:yes stop_codon:yes gene_type:complete